MKIDNINIDDALTKAKGLLSEEKELSPAMRSMFDLLILIITLLMCRLNKNSGNSSKPPSQDPNREKERKPKGVKKPGGQRGHKGVTLQKIDNPDIVEKIKIDRRTLPRGEYKDAGYEARQVFNIEIKRIVTEYQAEVLEDSKGNRFVASFPEGVSKAAQYGESVKEHSVYMSQFQLIPYNRLEDYFQDQLQIPISGGTIYNFNLEAYKLLDKFEERVKDMLFNSLLIHVDETGINIKGVRFWLHCTSNGFWTYFFPHAKRGTDAIDDIGILPEYKGKLCHDHWKPYLKYDCIHVLCNAHHLRELTSVWENDKHQWALDLRTLLEEICHAVNNAGGVLTPSESEKYQEKYLSILINAEVECPPPDLTNRKGKRGPVKRTKARNLLERLLKYKDEVLRFMDDILVPFTNNLCENDIRMTKVQQKISGCFRSMNGAKIFCRIRSYLSTCRKHGLTSSKALEILFRGELPDFMNLE